MDMWYDVSQVFKIRSGVKNKGFWKKYLTFCWFGREREGEKKKIQVSFNDPQSSVDQNSSSQEPNLSSR